jgi:hypothetical protein
MTYQMILEKTVFWLLKIEGISLDKTINMAIIQVRTHPLETKEEF